MKQMAAKNDTQDNTDEARDVFTLSVLEKAFHFFLATLWGCLLMHSHPYTHVPYQLSYSLGIEAFHSSVLEKDKNKIVGNSGSAQIQDVQRLCGVCGIRVLKESMVAANSSYCLGIFLLLVYPFFFFFLILILGSHFDQSWKTKKKKTDEEVQVQRKKAMAYN